MDIRDYPALVLLIIVMPTVVLGLVGIVCLG
jgi:hypothetical protein